jgi:phosphatidylserine decarboxylase
LTREGIPFVLIPLAAALAAFALGYWYAAAALLLVALFMAYFFRDPHRAAPADETLVVAPADGRVTRVSPLDPADPQSPTVVSIFLSVFDVHVNRSPIAGEVTEVTYTKGRFQQTMRRRSRRRPSTHAGGAA